METKVRALCIQATTYKENDKILTLISAEMGRISARIRSANSPKSKLRLAASPLCFGEYILSGTKDRFVVTGCTVEESFFACWEDLDRYTAAQIILEVLNKTAYDASDCREEALNALKALAVVNYGDIYPYVPAVWFLLRVLPALGGDFEESDAPERLRALAKSMQQTEPAFLDAFEMSGAELFSLLNYLHLLLRAKLSDKLHAIGEALKLFQH